MKIVLIGPAPDLDHVADVEIPDVAPGANLPEVILWGARVFYREPGPASRAGTPGFVEVKAVAVPAALDLRSINNTTQPSCILGLEVISGTLRVSKDGVSEVFRPVFVPQPVNEVGE